MPKTLMPDDVVAAAAAAEAALRPVVGRDWSVRAGPLDWDVEQTIAHMIGAPAKYTLYLASRCQHFIALSVTRWPDATHEEVIDSVVPAAAGLAAVAAVTPPGVRAYHVTGPSSAADYVGRACVELLVHTDDALSGLGVAFAPPAGLCQRVLAQQYPDAAGPGRAWHRLLAATGRPIRRSAGPRERMLSMALQGEYVPSPAQWVRDQVEAYERSGGREANTLRDTGLPVVIVTMRGNRSEKIRKIALMRVEHDGEYALVASKGGSPAHPVWYYNLKAHPDEVTIQDGPEPFGVRVREITGDERAAWWERAVAAFPPYAEYQQRTEREIPVFVAVRKEDHA